MSGPSPVTSGTKTCRPPAATSTAAAPAPARSRRWRADHALFQLIKTITRICQLLSPRNTAPGRPRPARQHNTHFGSFECMRHCFNSLRRTNHRSRPGPGVHRHTPRAGSSSTRRYVRGLAAGRARARVVARIFAGPRGGRAPPGRVRLRGGRGRPGPVVIVIAAARGAGLGHIGREVRRASERSHCQAHYGPRPPARGMLHMQLHVARARDPVNKFHAGSIEQQNVSCTLHIIHRTLR